MQSRTEGAHGGCPEGMGVQNSTEEHKSGVERCRTTPEGVHGGRGGCIGVQRNTEGHGSGVGECRAAQKGIDQVWRGHGRAQSSRAWKGTEGH